MTLTTGLHILDFLLGIFVGLLLFIFSVNVIKKITVFTKKAPILKIVDKRTVNKIDGHSDNSGTKKRKTSCGMSTTKKEDADLISNLKMGQEVKRNERQEKALEDMRKGKLGRS